MLYIDGSMYVPQRDLRVISIAASLKGNLLRPRSKACSSRFICYAIEVCVHADMVITSVFINEDIAYVLLLLTHALCPRASPRNCTSLHFMVETKASYFFSYDSI